MIAALFFTLGISWAQSTDAFERAMTAYRAKDYSASRDILSDLVARNPKKALYWFNLGNAQFLLGDYAKAAFSFGMVQRLGSGLAPAAALYQARAWRNSGETARARAALESLARRSDLPAGLRDAIARELEDMSSPRALALDLYHQGRYLPALREIAKLRPLDEDGRLLKAMILIKLDREDQARVLLSDLERTGHGATRELGRALVEGTRGTKARAYWIYLSSDLGLDDNPRSTSAPAASPTADLDIGGGARLWGEGFWYQNLSASVSWLETTRDRDLRITGEEVVTALGRAVGPDLLLLSPYLYTESWGGTPARLARGARVHARKGSEEWEGGVTAAWQFDTPLVGGDETAHGTNAVGRLYLGQIRAPHYAQAFVDFFARNTGEGIAGDGSSLPSAHRGWGPGARFLWRFDPRWALDLSATWRKRDFEGRVETETSVGARLSRLLRADLNAHVTLDYTQGRSTLDLAETSGLNFERKRILTGVTWDAF